ncbi:MAG: class I SAM-dependent methyltransferase [Chloroflexi bacterium]|nr:class I SAM-dependent methyltransferase [Chloroflexota bacterium]MBM4451987.1 class I SAM-dependent methyltransferase [Chloroflexota bacterium]MBM4453889.1 class I SAM-dependent methyltransferase [Chloroflexota bacterium]
MTESTTSLFESDISLTNEERRVSVYSAIAPPTTPSTVARNTPLENLNLNWREKDLPERERTKHVHRLHPYLGKFIPQLVEIFLRKYFEPKQTILDPFCGSGTTLVQANELEINSIGYDISAFNVLLSRAKVQRYEIDRARIEILDALNKLRRFTQETTQLRLWEDRATELNIPETDNEYLRLWYAPKALNELLTYRYLIQNEGYLYQDLLKVILSRSARSSRLTTHYDLDFPKRPQTQPYQCRKHSRTCYPTTEAFKFLNRYSFDTLSRIEEFAVLRTNAEVEIHHADSRCANFPPIHGVITSPPYVGLIDYHDQHAYAYHLLGLEDRRNAEIGPAVNGSSHRAKRQYQIDVANVFRRAVDAMVPGGLLVVVIHDSANLYPEIASLCGVEVVAALDRHVNRRTGRRSNEFYESIFIWRKP